MDSILQQLGSVLQNILSPAATGALSLARGLTTGILSTVYVLVIFCMILTPIPPTRPRCSRYRQRNWRQ